MSDAADNSNALVRPPVALLLAFVGGLGIDWLYPLRLVPADISGGWVGAAVFAAGFALALWAIATFRDAGTRVETYKATSTIVESGPYRFTRNPIYVGMFVGLIGLAIGFNSLRILAALVTAGSDGSASSGKRVRSLPGQATALLLSALLAVLAASPIHPEAQEHFIWAFCYGSALGWIAGWLSKRRLPC
jgi:hypothetical protein